ncbi:MAG TPA: Na-translocating system protein MpsC family protein [Solirubrobacteraceae bacterium]|jgi:uncharacterized protein YbcI|nr:Na-translocating system protein MpsC family protein [Solirubrobacteraceae bacterium]
MPEFESRRAQGGQTLVQLSNGVVHLLREFAGKGPKRCKAYWAGQDLLVILLSGGFTAADQTLFDAGRGGSVRDAQHALQDALELRMTALVENLTDRTVLAFMSASHQAPDLRVELFVLKPDESRPPLLTEKLESI